MAKVDKNIITASIRVSVPEAAIEKLAQSNMDTLGRVATFLLQESGSGGFLLEAATVAQLSEMSGIPVSTQEDILELVGKTVHRKDGAVTAEWLVDPSFVPPFQERAESQGRTVQSLVQEFMDWVMNQGLEQGWMYEMPNVPHPLYVSDEDYRELSEIMGVKQPNGTEIAAFIKSMAASPMGAKT